MAPTADRAAALSTILDEIDALPEGVQREIRAVLQAALDVTGEGVVALIERLADAGVDVARLPDDPAIAALFTLCGLEAAPATAVEIGARPTCEVCGQVIGTAHEHAADVHDRRLLCVCQPCAISLNGEGRYQTLRGRSEKVADDAAPPAWWTALELPVQLVFFARSSVDGPGPTAFYPGAGGVVESDLAVGALPVDLATDTQALLVRNGLARFEAWVVPIDRCYELAGVLRHGPLGLPVDALAETFFSTLP